MSKGRPVVTLLALPLGNPEDLSLRGARALREADRLFCEDTRKLHQLLQALGLELKPSCRVSSLPGDEEWNFNWKYLQDDAEKLGAIYQVVLVSDAGTPGLNDPGRALAEHAQREGWELRALPGPSAPVLALQWTGGFGMPFVFWGFSPKSRGKTFRDFQAALKSSGTLACFETRHQVLETLEALVEVGLGETRMHLCREMTKTHEELWTGSVSEILERTREKLARDDAIGELTLLFEGEGRAAGGADGVQDPVAFARKILELRSLPPKAASKVLAELSGIDKAEAYRMLIDSKESQ
jgi:16S rRNA (cytidine1402-2'-O)-methyltransferase